MELYHSPALGDDTQLIREVIFLRTLTAGFAKANEQIYALAANDTTKTNMGSTLVAAVVRGGSLYVANVGDSRAYLVRGKAIRQITRDHSWVVEQVRARVLTEEQAQQHAYRNIITRAVGSKPEVKADLFRQRLKSKDTLVLCSDGLSSMVEAREIREIVSGVSNPDQAAERLIELANERGGEDNITAIVVQVPCVPTMWPWVVVAAFVLAVVLTATCLVIYFLFHVQDLLEGLTLW